MFVTLAVCERDRERLERLRALVTDLTIQENLEVQVYWLFGDNQRDKLHQYAPCLNLALISLDLPDALDMGRALYADNPDCYILYYKQEGCDLAPTLCTRPVAFHAGAVDCPALRSKLTDICRELWSRRSFFRYESKSALCLLPYGSIQYAESDYKYVLLHLTRGAPLRLFAKLDDIQKKLDSPRFLRVHKSYLINLQHIQGVDKTNRCILLCGGGSIPISKSYYERTLAALRA